MTDPFRIEGPALVSFSGGRTSALMLRRILDAYDGALPPDVVVLFANTGKERTETLAFVVECGMRWGVPITWVERRVASERYTEVFGPALQPYRVVDTASASREGEPFASLIEERSYLPNPVTRYCTTELKIRVMRDYLRSLAWKDDEWTNVIGFRADEPSRVAKLKGRNTEGRWDTAVPLFDAGITKVDVDAFWRAQPFDLRLQPWEGNCDICFLKGVTKAQRIIGDNPNLAAWWIAQEKKVETTAGTAARFRIDRPSYARLYDVTTRQLRLFQDEEPGACNIDDVDDCSCGDWQDAA